MSTEAHVRETYPEIDTIKSDSLREQVVEAWILTLERSEYDDLEAIPGMPLNEGPWAVGISNVEHTRSVAQLAASIAETMCSFCGLDVNVDHVVAGALCHDMGKYFEFTGLDDGTFVKGVWKSSDAPVRHPIFSAAIAWEVGLPPEVIHIVANHAREGEHIVRSKEANIVKYADHMYWLVAIQQEMGVSHDELMAGDKLVV